jgi:hypothetical protein
MADFNSAFTEMLIFVFTTTSGDDVAFFLTGGVAINGGRRELGMSEPLSGACSAVRR